jgi:hypothetical protein
MKRAGSRWIMWVLAVVAVAIVGVTWSARTAHSIDPTPVYPAPPEAIMGGQQAVLSIANEASSTCHATLGFHNTRGGSLATETIDVAPGVIRSFTFTPRIGATTRLTLLADVVSVNASCTAFASSLQIVDTKTNRNISIVAGGDPEG